MAKKKIKNQIENIKKRDGRVVIFDRDRINNAIRRAFFAVHEEGEAPVDSLCDKVVLTLNERFKGRTPSVEDIQDVVEETLIKDGYSHVAKSFILYRQKRAEIREAKYFLLDHDIRTKLTENALKVLEGRYLKKDENGKIVETPSQLFKRVAQNIASAEKIYNPEISDDELFRVEEEFYKMMALTEYMPNSPTLMNAGLPLQQLSACFVIPVEDSMESIFTAVKDTAIIHQTGGGTGFNFSHLRPKGDRVKSTSGIASGPISFMTVFDAATEVIKQGGKRRGANMGILQVDHPDIMEFIHLKEKEGVLKNFNISVAVTDEFMEKVANNENYDLINPKNRQVAGQLNAREVFNEMIRLAWTGGDPGIIFIDKMNRDNPTPKLGRIESTNPCGEVPLLGYESCNLGSINLEKMIKKTGKKYEVDWEKLGATVRKAAHFLDNVIDMNKYPLKEIDAMTRGNRKIGLGVMGFADMLMRLQIPYNSEEAVKMGEKVMKFVSEEAKIASQEMAKARGVFSNFTDSIYDKPDGLRMRNATTNSIAPTGTISIIAGCSSSIEPIFALAYRRISYIGKTTDAVELLEVNAMFEEVAKERGFYSKELVEKIAEKGSCQGLDEVPKDVRDVFVTSHDISPEWHVKMQAAFQKYTDLAVSKTINFPFDATIEDVEKGYTLAYKLGCKGITIFRNESRVLQVLNIGTKKDGDKKEPSLQMEIKKEVIEERTAPVYATEPAKLEVSDGMELLPPSACKTCQI
jgi:ribonucleoside-diphosphate reductase alpha chain